MKKVRRKYDMKEMTQIVNSLEKQYLQGYHDVCAL